MLGRTLLGLAALIVATSCVPMRYRAAPPAVTTAITPSEAALLRRLALDAPGDTDEPEAEVAVPARDATAFVRAPSFTQTARTIGDADRAVTCLTAAVYYEARSESRDGQRAVAQVVLNRVRDRAFPGSVCGVVYQRSAKGCQFSFACDGSTGHAVDPAAWQRARTIATAAFDGAVYAPVGAATYYHTTAVSPWWATSLARIGQIGAHIFYGWHRAMADALTFRRRYAGVEPDAAVQVASALPTAVDAGPTTVTVHRGEGTPAAGTTLAGFVTVQGVRIHRGGEVPLAAAMAQPLRVGPEGDEPTTPADPI